MDRHGRHLAFGSDGYNPEGVRIGQDKNKNFKAVKVWDKREYKNLDDSVELGTRNIVALRRLRQFARDGEVPICSTLMTRLNPPPMPAISTLS